MTDARVAGAGVEVLAGKTAVLTEAGVGVEVIRRTAQPVSTVAGVGVEALISRPVIAAALAGTGVEVLAKLASPPAGSGRVRWGIALQEV